MAKWAKQNLPAMKKIAAYQLMENMDKGFGAYHVVADGIFLRRNTSE
jgi:hypothetical protein